MFFAHTSLLEIYDVAGLKNDLHARLHGQHLVIPAVLRSVKSHTSDSNPQKPLVLSFHGTYNNNALTNRYKY